MAVSLKRKADEIVNNASSASNASNAANTRVSDARVTLSLMDFIACSKAVLARMFGALRKDIKNTASNHNNRTYRYECKSNVEYLVIVASYRRSIDRVFALYECDEFVDVVCTAYNLCYCDMGEYYDLFCQKFLSGVVESPDMCHQIRAIAGLINMFGSYEEIPDKLADFIEEHMCGIGADKSTRRRLRADELKCIIAASLHRNSTFAYRFIGKWAARGLIDMPTFVDMIWPSGTVEDASDVIINDDDEALLTDREKIDRANMRFALITHIVRKFKMDKEAGKLIMYLSGADY
jgi:hypothetical protein